MKAKDWLIKARDIEGPQKTQLIHMAQCLDTAEKSYERYHREMDKWMQCVYEFAKEDITNSYTGRKNDT